MKIICKILSDAIDFALKKDIVLKVLDFVACSENFNICQVISELVKFRNETAKFRISFEFILREVENTSLLVIILIKWKQKHGFKLKNIKILSKNKPAVNTLPGFSTFIDNRN